jgi:hypothetical protein
MRGSLRLGTDLVELDLHPALLADPFKVEFHSLPEYRMKHLRHRWARF